MPKFLFVGGSNDGKRIEFFKTLPQIELLVNAPPVSLADLLEEVLVQPQFQIEFYYLTEIALSSNRECVSFYRHSSLTTRGALEELLKGYRVSDA